MTNSNQKGKRGERECAAFLRDFGYEARRGQQFSGGDDSPDVVHSIEGVHIEVKRVEAFNAYKALAQADEDKGDDKMSAVFHKRNRKPWIVVLYAEDFMDMIQEMDKNG